MKRAEVRQHEAVTAKNIEKVEVQKEKVAQISSQIKDQDIYNVGVAKSENAHLLGFAAGADDEEFVERRGGRGGRRGGRGGFRGDRGGFRGGDREQRGGHRGQGKKLHFNEEAFPTL